jgi:hypothetical protein
MKKLITILAALAVSVSFANAADAAKKEAKAEKKGATPEERFKKLDTNGDGFISLEEFKASPAGQKDAAKADEIFKKKDKDGDGKLSAEEFAAGGGKKGDAAKPGDAKPGDAKKGDAAVKVEPAKPGAPGEKPAGPEGAK